MKRQTAFFYVWHLPLWRRLPIPLGLAVLLSLAYPLLARYDAATTHAAVFTPVVVIDPGHGGYDPGVKSGDIDEADLTLAIAQQLKTALEQRGIRAILTRETDTDFAPNGARGKTAKRADLDARIHMVEQNNANLFVSLHMNNSSAATRGGAEVFYKADVPGSEELALGVQKALQGLPQMSKRDAKSVDYYLLRNLKVPALIIECGYLNISAERARLMSQSYQVQMAGAIADAIAEFSKTFQPPEPTPKAPNPS